MNLAARLEALAQPGGICVSRVVRDQVRDRLDYTFEDYGEQSVRNITRPVRVFAMLFDGAVGVPEANASSTASTSPPVAPRLSIVVLPFNNLSNDPEQQYFADRITEDLTTDLSRLGDMLVISCNIAFTSRNNQVDTKQIGRELGVRYILEGSVRRSGNRVRVNAQTDRCHNGYAFMDGTVRPRHGRPVLFARRNHQQNRERARHAADRRGGRAPNRAFGCARLHSAGTRRCVESEITGEPC